MAKAKCQTAVDSSGRELINHGTHEYPLSFCHDNLGENDVAWHWHEEFEAVFVSEGSAVVAAGEQRFIVRAGEGFFINSGVLHGCWDYENSSCRFHSLVFSPRLVGGAAESIFFSKYIDPLAENRGLPFVFLSPDVGWQAEALAHIERAWQANDRETDFYELESRAELSKLLALIHRNSPWAATAQKEKRLRQGERMKLMLRFINDNMGEKLTVGDISASANISESECLRCFRDSIHTTPIQYLRTHRIQQAAVLLCSTQEKISVIAQLCGFDDMSYFTKIFRQQKGCSPSEYRKNGYSSRILM